MSETSIANRGLLKLGQPRVSNINTDGTPNAVIMSDIFADVRDELLRSYPWNFATKRKSLAASDEPVWGWDNAFPLPSDFLRLLEIKDVTNYSVEGGSILCDESDIIYISYVARITDTGLFPPIFGALLSQDLALQACDRITDDVGLKQSLILERKQLEWTVKTTDALENSPVSFDDDDWLNARL